MLIVGSIVIRVDDLQRQVAFWTAALGYVVRQPAEADFAILSPPDGVGPNISLDAVPSARVLPPRIHLDLYAEQQDEEVRRLTALGASRCTGPSVRRMRTTSSWKTPKATGSAWSTRGTGRGGESVKRS